MSGRDELSINIESQDKSSNIQGILEKVYHEKYQFEEIYSWL